MAKGFDLFTAKVADKLSAKYTGNQAIDWQMILDFLIKIIPLVAGCFLARPKTLRRRLGNHARVAIAARQVGVNGAEAREWANAVFDAADEATDAELQSFIDDCCSSR